ncbi:unnamed protein product, partial [Pleuronectes platessa]
IRSSGRAQKEGSVKQLPLYDTPYEPAENGGDSDHERSRCPRESRLPQDDERPPEEYDQPWEWKKERISKAFAALLCYDCISYEGSVSGTGSGPHRRTDCTSKSLTVQFDGVDKSRMSPTKDGKNRPLQRHSSSCLVNTKMTSLDHCSSSLGERIDPTMPLESQFWYHGAISRTDAESLLRLCKEASYLVRNSETSKNDYSLSLKSSQGFMHMKLSRTKENEYILGQNSCPFDSVPEIIHFYSSRKLPIKGAEHMSLLYPASAPCSTHWTTLSGSTLPVHSPAGSWEDEQWHPKLLILTHLKPLSHTLEGAAGKGNCRLQCSVLMKVMFDSEIADTFTLKSAFRASAFFMEYVLATKQLAGLQERAQKDKGRRSTSYQPCLLLWHDGVVHPDRKSAAIVLA